MSMGQHPPTTAQGAGDRNLLKTTVDRKNYCQLFCLRDAHSLTTASSCLQRGDAIAGSNQGVAASAASASQRVTPCHPVSPACHPVSPRVTVSPRGLIFYYLGQRETTVDSGSTVF